MSEVVESFRTHTPFFKKGEPRRGESTGPLANTIYCKYAHLEGDLHDLSCSHDQSSLQYTVSLWAEVSKVEKHKVASTGPSSGLHDCL